MSWAPPEMDLLSIYDADTATLTSQLQQLTLFLNNDADLASSTTYARACHQRDCIGLELQERKSSEAAAVGVLRSIALPSSTAPSPARAPVDGSGATSLSSISSAARSVDQPAASMLLETVVTSSGVSVPTVGGKTLAQRLAEERRAEKMKKAKDKVDKAERAAAADRAMAAEAEAAAQRAGVAQRAAAERLKEMRRKAAAAAAEQAPARPSAGGSRAAAGSISGTAGAAGRGGAHPSGSAGSGANARPGLADRAHSARPLGNATPAPRPARQRAVTAEDSPGARQLTAGRQDVDGRAREVLACTGATSDAKDGQWLQSRAGAPGSAWEGAVGPAGEAVGIPGVRGAPHMVEPSVDGEIRSPSCDTDAGSHSGWARGEGGGAAGHHEWDGGLEDEAVAGMAVGAMEAVEVGSAEMAAAAVVEMDEEAAGAGVEARAEAEESVAGMVGETAEAGGPSDASGRASSTGEVEEEEEGQTSVFGAAGPEESVSDKAASAQEECDDVTAAQQEEEECDEPAEDFDDDFGSEGVVEEETRLGARVTFPQGSGSEGGAGASAVIVGSDAYAGVDAMAAARERLRAFSTAADSEAGSEAGSEDYNGAESEAESEAKSDKLSDRHSEWPTDGCAGSRSPAAPGCSPAEGLEWGQGGRCGGVGGAAAGLGGWSGGREGLVSPCSAGERGGGGDDGGAGSSESFREAPPGEPGPVFPREVAGEPDTSNGAAAAGRSDSACPVMSLPPNSTLDRLRLMFPGVSLPQLRAVLDALREEAAAVRADAGACGGAGAQNAGSSPASCGDGDALSPDSPPFSRAAAAVYRSAFVFRKIAPHGLAAARPGAAAKELASRFGRFEDLWCSSSGAPSRLLPAPDILAAHLAMASSWEQGLRLCLGARPAAAWKCRFVRVAQARAEVHEILGDFCAASARGAAGSGTGGGARSGTGLGGAHLDGPASAAGAAAGLLVWVELPEAPEGGERLAPGWDLLWTWKAPRVALNELLPWQRVNHFPHSRQLTRKDLLKKNLQRARAAPGRTEAYDVMPLTFALPAEYNAFAMAFAACREEAEETGGANVWIMKPTGSGASRGRRIALLNDIVGVSYGEAVVLQRYVEKPLLLDGLKFDLRLYVLVTSFNPLEAFLYTEGFGRFASEPYTLDPGKLGDLYVHLTNSSIQKERPAGEGARSGLVESDEGGSKCSLKGLAARLAAAGVPWAAVWASIREVVLRSLAAVQDAIPHQRNSFELFGYDILIDEQLKCWLIEVNASPSLARDNPLDFAVKDRLVADTLQLVAPPYFDRAVWAEMLRARLEPRGGVRVIKGAPAAEFADELCAMLHGEPPRLYGKMPAHLGLYERIAPSPLWDRVCKRK